MFPDRLYLGKCAYSIFSHDQILALHTTYHRSHFMYLCENFKLIRSFAACSFPESRDSAWFSLSLFSQHLEEWLLMVGSCKSFIKNNETLSNWNLLESEKKRVTVLWWRRLTLNTLGDMTMTFKLLDHWFAQVLESLRDTQTDRQTQTQDTCRTYKTKQLCWALKMRSTVIVLYILLLPMHTNIHILHTYTK